ncbi:hypothetical protein PgNI_10743 [Pyricularia grisea]|uniref:Uncharacterized protein n=1 Tax=Pyricularia grisea TaxID=148305 RepID=A0A6P8AXC8_PYRGI|nr:hypothetical protein PgNI_10743 [Pyricularia grisea]TLD06987.1 hypothetical protein PgNI_10743 [Pyricularia grisea]
MANRKHRQPKKSKASQQKAGQQGDGGTADGTTALTSSEQRLAKETQDDDRTRGRGGGEVVVVKYYTPHTDNSQARGRSSSVPCGEKPSMLSPEDEKKTGEGKQSGE